MFARFMRSLRKQSEQDAPVDAEPASESGASRRRLDSLRRTAQAEGAAPVTQREVAPAIQEERQPRIADRFVTVSPFKKQVTENPNDAAKRLLPVVLGIENQAVREFLLACARDQDEVWTAERTARHNAAMEAAILTGDPLDVALDLQMRTAARRGLPNPAGEFRRINVTFDAISRRAWKLAGDDPRFSDAQMRKAISAMGKMIAAGCNDRNDIFDRHYWHIVRAAAADAWPKWKQPLVSAFSDAFGGQTFNHKQVTALVERLLQETPLVAADVPELAAADEASARLDAIRDRIAADLGEPFGAALLRLLDERNGYIDAKTIPELEALRALEPAERGIGFTRYLDVLTGLDRFGVTEWGQLERQDGKYRFGIVYDKFPVKFSFLFQQLTRRKIVVPDADATVARFCDLLPAMFYLKDRKVLELVLDTMRQHPGGATEARMRAFLDRSQEQSAHTLDGLNGAALVQSSDIHPFREYRIEIEEALRSLPRQPLPYRGSDHDRAAPAVSASALQGLPPLSPPDLNLDGYGFWDRLREHFANVFDARLYDTPHRKLIDRLADLDAHLRAHHDRGGAQTTEAIAEVVWRNGFKGVDFVPAFIRDTASMAVRIRNRLNAFAPFVTQFPEQSRKLSVLVEMLGAKSAPARKWLDEGDRAIAGIDARTLVTMLDSLVANTVPSDLDLTGDATLRSLIFLSSRFDPDVIAPRLASFAIRDGYAKHSSGSANRGIKNEKLGNACVWALSEMPHAAGIPYLARIQSRVNYPKIKGFIDKRLDAAAEKAALSRGELDELTVPTHGLDHASARSLPLGDGEAVIQILGDAAVVDWVASNGKSLKSPSQAMKADAAALKTVRSLAKEINADLLVQINRLQRVYLEQRSWPVELWNQRYCAHPLVGPIARRLIWWLDRADGTSLAVLPAADGQALHAVTGEEVVATADARVRLWHPIEAATADIEAWRDRLGAEQLEQPFPQAWREVYLLTDAERETGTYSNRWAAHILRQHQTMELARANGWKVTHRLGYDVRNDEVWHRMIPAYGLVADYWVEGFGGHEASFSPGGAFTYIATDRLQFHAIDPKAKDSARGPVRGDAVPLVDIPAIVFSEIMRQGDLFTSVASIGNDPDWLDQGAEADHPDGWRRRANDYWQRFNAGELQASASRRRAILERTLPRLKMADRFSLDDRYLLVQGTRHAYRIHLGGGGAFRGERHICIVPKSEPSIGKVWLPFEGDRTLSIILSKALLLAQDDKITDPVILGQL